MLSFKEFILEARKNPEMNPKISIVDQIKAEYETVKNDRLDSGVINGFISFTALKKLGINPINRHNAPTGIYAYPISFVVKTVKRTMDELPFAGDRPYVYSFQVNENSNIVILSSMSPHEEESYHEKIYDFFSKKSGMSLQISTDVVEEIIADSYDKAALPDSAGGRFWYATERVAAKMQEIKKRGDFTSSWNSLMMGIGIDGCADYGAEIINMGEPFQAVFFSKNVIKNEKLFENKDRIKPSQFAITQRKKMNQNEI